LSNYEKIFLQMFKVITQNIIQKYL